MRKDAELQALIGTTAFFFFILIILFYFSVVIMVLWDHASLLYLKAKYAWLSLFPLTTRMCVFPPPLPSRSSEQFTSHLQRPTVAL